MDRARLNRLPCDAARLGRALVQFIAGEGHVIIPAFDAGDVLKAIGEEHVSDVLLVPAMIQAVLNHPDFATTDLTSLKRLTSASPPGRGGAVLRAFWLTSTQARPTSMVGANQ